MKELEKLKHNGFEFEIRTSIKGENYCVEVFIEDSQVCPITYSVDVEYEEDQLNNHKESLVKVLIDRAKEDILNDIYFGGKKLDDS